MTDPVVHGADVERAEAHAERLVYAVESESVPAPGIIEVDERAAVVMSRVRFVGHEQSILICLSIGAAGDGALEISVRDGGRIHLRILRGRAGE